MEAIEPWGFHLILGVAKCDHQAITSREVIYDFAKDLVNKIDMVAYGEPQIVNFGSGNKSGYTLVQLIETSNICVHFCNETDTFHLDVFSCKEFDSEIVKVLCKQYFSGTITQEVFLNRYA